MSADDSLMRAYERYILTDKNLQEGLNLLRKGSTDEMYLTLMHTLNTKGWGAVNADKDLKAKFDSYVKSFGFSTVAARAKFLEYDEEKDAKKKDDILKEIC